MSEFSVATEAKPTPLAAQLFAGAEQRVLRGALTPARLDAPEAETATLVTGAALHDLGWLRRFAVRGEDRFRWLSGMVTNTVHDLEPNQGAWNLVLNAQGRIQGDVHVWRKGEELDLVIAADQCECLLAHLDKFIIMDDVELVPLPAETAIGLSGPLAADILAKLTLPVPTEEMTAQQATWQGHTVEVARAYGTLISHFELWINVENVAALADALLACGAKAVGAEATEALRIAEGIPLYGTDIAERDLPQETSQLRALHFKKGCYLGQEIVERIRSRGNVHRHLRSLEVFGPLPAAGTELKREDGSVAGQLTSAAVLSLPTGARSYALGVIRAEAELRRETFSYGSASAGEGTAQVLSETPLLERS